MPCQEVGFSSTYSCFTTVVVRRGCIYSAWSCVSVGYMGCPAAHWVLTTVCEITDKETRGHLAILPAALWYRLVHGRHLGRQRRKRTRDSVKIFNNSKFYALDAFRQQTYFFSFLYLSTIRAPLISSIIMVHHRFSTHHVSTVNRTAPDSHTTSTPSHSTSLDSLESSRN